ncbi:hypothetical protein PybrP1_005901 [[Pythium] brassicae (nom. inval.)]|nr:hypothetical protein PybrP1_005901 [[Pythium] brassicae (nom. inval.)]
MGGAHLGLAMPMGGMQAPLRAYPPAAPAPDGSLSYWRTQPPPQLQLADPSAAAYPKHGGLELEFSEIMDGAASSDAHASGAAAMGAQAEAADVVMSAVLSPSFEVSSFGDHMNAGVVGTAKPGYHLSSSGSGSTSPPYPPRLRPEPRVQGGATTAAEAMETTLAGPMPADDAAPGRLRRSSSGASSVGSSSSSAAAAAESSGTGGYAHVLDAYAEPDLRQRKVEGKSEKCQFHNCPNRARVAQAYGVFCNRHVIVAPCGFPGCRERALAGASMCERHVSEGKEALHRVLATRAQNVPTCRTFGCFKNDQGRGYCRGHEKLLMATGKLPKHVNKRRLNSAYTMCSYPGCSKHSQRHHLCRTHGNLIKKQAEELHSRRAASASESFEDILTRLQQDIRKCTQPTCTKNSQRDRLCTLHYYEKHGGGTRDGGLPGASDGGASGAVSSATAATDDRLAVKAADSADADSADAPSKATKTLPCSVPDCGRRAFADGVCKSHSTEVLKSPGTGSGAAGAASGIREVERTRCGVPGCAQMVFASGVCTQHLRQSQSQSPQQQPTPSSNGAGVFNRFASALSPFGDERFSPPPLEAANSRASGDGFFPGASGSGGYTGASMEPNVVSYAGRQSVPSADVGTASRGEVDATEALYALNAKPAEPAGAYADSKSSSSGASGGAACHNPMCSRAASFSREYCDACQSVFAPLAVSAGDPLAGTSSYAYAASPSLSQPEPESSVDGGKARGACRVSRCAAASVSYDGVAGGGKPRKYFCKSDGCGKLAQRKGYCKRHVRQQEQAALGASSQSPATAQAPPPPATTTTTATATAAPMKPCRFSGCAHFVSGAPLCGAHRGATYCWQPGCENIVALPQLCEAHAYRRQCAYENCAYAAAEHARGGCAHHAAERRCSHAHCDKFAVGAGDRCRLHQISCADEPCALCALRAAPPPPEKALGRRPWPPAPHPHPLPSSRRVDVENALASGNS